jgi:hypothetical protein
MNRLQRGACDAPHDSDGFCVYGSHGWPGCGFFNDGNGCLPSAGYAAWHEQRCEELARKSAHRGSDTGGPSK